MEAKAREGIDYRKDTPPTDWLSKKVETLRASTPNPPTHKDLGFEFMSDLLEELNSLRCQDPCPTQSGAIQTGVTTPADLPCVCGLIARISDLTGEWVTKNEFLAVLQKFHYSTDKALGKYSTYALDKIENKYSGEFKRLYIEGSNAYNWSREGSYEAGKALEDVIAELGEMQKRCEAELAELMA